MRAGKIFISYRRQDSQDLTGRIKDWLANRFGDDNIFLDVAMPGGVDFVATLEERLQRSDVLVAVIGERWADAVHHTTGERRLFDPEDLVRREIEHALQRGIPIFPVLINRAQFPSAADLPDSMLPFLRMNAKPVTHENFEAEIARVIADIEQAFARADLTISDKAARRWSEAEEIEAWRFVGERKRGAEVREHLERFPGGATERMARVLLDDLEWERAQALNTQAGYEAFLAEFGGGAHAAAARARSAQLEEQARQAQVEAAERARRAREDEAERARRDQERQAKEIARREAAEAGWDKLKNSHDVEGLRELAVQYREYPVAKAAEERIFEIKSIQRRRIVLGALGATFVLGGGAAAIVFRRRIALKFADTSIRTFHGDGAFGLASAAFLPDGEHVLIGGSYELVLWNALTGKRVRKFGAKVKNGEGRIWSVSISSDGRKALTGRMDSDFVLWDVGTGEALYTLRGRKFGAIATAMVPGLGGSLGISGGDGGFLKVWNLETGQLIRTFGKAGRGIGSISVSADGRQLLDNGGNTGLRLWDIASGRLIRSFKQKTGAFASIAITPDGAKAIVGSSKSHLKLLDLASGREVWSIAAHDGQVYGVAVSPDGRRALSAGMDGLAKLWDLADGRELAVFEGHSRGVTSVAFSPNGKYAITTSDDDTAKLWAI
ncbi:MAG: TIR domain-containing protein [Neomegalonema sp.]|nr:TIR domain-containing protein [Neomegalonema sp.]